MIISIDPGLKNLAICRIDERNNRIHEWEVSGIPPEHDNGIYVSLRDHLDKRPWVLEAETVLIEKQPDKNKKMVSIMNFLNAYFIIKNPKAETIIYDARHKIPDISGSGKRQYRKRKNASVERCDEFINKNEINNEHVEMFSKSKKKDDLADTVMQALSFINRIETTKPKYKKLVARKPNENQKNTKYSKSNLAWIYKNTKNPQDDKRFMRDLKRYYNSVDELVSYLSS